MDTIGASCLRLSIRWQLCSARACRVLARRDLDNQRNPNYNRRGLGTRKAKAFESTSSQMPPPPAAVIATNWSGPTAFMTDANSYPLPIEGLQPVAGMPGHQWAAPSLPALQHLLAHAAAHPEEARARGRRAFLETQGLMCSDFGAASLPDPASQILPSRPFQTLPLRSCLSDLFRPCLDRSATQSRTSPLVHAPSCLHQLPWGLACSATAVDARASSLLQPHVPA